MIFRYAPPAREEWRAMWIQIAGSLAALAILTWLRPNPAVLLGITAGTLFMLAPSITDLRRKTRRARYSSIELRPDTLTLHDGPQATVIPWTAIARCEPIETNVQLHWRDGESPRIWTFAPREILDGQTLARELKQRTTPNFIALEAK